jgi:hypothetical protein
VNELMRWMIPGVLLLFTALSLCRRLSAGEFRSVSRRHVIYVHTIVASWFMVAVVAQLQGGTALWGDVQGNAYVLRHNPSSSSS